MTHDIPPFYLDVLNQVFELEKKVAAQGLGRPMQRHLDKIRQAFEERCPLPGGGALVYHDPTGEPYHETRTDCEASVAGTSTQQLVVIETIKPIVYLRHDAQHHIVQRGVVIVQGN